MNRIIEVVVSPTGQVRVETKGFLGSSCQGASHFLTQALGVSLSEQRTAEFYQQEAEQQRLQEGGPA